MEEPCYFWNLNLVQQPDWNHTQTGGVVVKHHRGTHTPKPPCQLTNDTKALMQLNCYKTWTHVTDESIKKTKVFDFHQKVQHSLFIWFVFHFLGISVSNEAEQFYDVWEIFGGRSLFHFIFWCGRVLQSYLAGVIHPTPAIQLDQHQLITLSSEWSNMEKCNNIENLWDTRDLLSSFYKQNLLIYLATKVGKYFLYV